MVSFFLLSCFVEISELYANSVGPDLTPHSVASDLGLHCLPMSLLWDTRLIRVNVCGWVHRGPFCGFLMSWFQSFGLIRQIVCDRVCFTDEVPWPDSAS